MSDRYSDTTGESAVGHAESGQRDLDHDATTDRAIFEEARDRLEIAVESESENRWAAKADLEFCEGAQWDKQPYTTAEAMNQPEMTINLTDALVRRVVNNMKQQRPRGKAHPVGDGANVEKAQLINGIGRHVEYRSDAGVAYDWGGEMAVKIGWGFWRLIEEWASPSSMAKELRICPIFNTFSVYMDPAARMPTGQDADWVLITFKMKRTEYKRLYPKRALIAFNDTGKSDDKEWEDREEIRLAEYFRIREKAEKLYLLRGPDGTEYTRYESEMPSDEGLKASKTEIVDERESSRRTVEWFLLNGTKIVDRNDLPGQWIPVIRCQGNAVDIDGRIKRRGMVRVMQDPARMVNYGETAKIKRLGISSQAKWLMAEGMDEGHEEWSDSNNSANPVLKYKPVMVPNALGGELPLPPPQLLPPAQVEAGFSEFVAGMRTNLLFVAGMMHDPGMDDQQGTIVSGRALKRRERQSDQSHFQYYDNQVLAIAHTWRIMLEWIPHTYSEQRMQRIIQEDGTPAMVKINDGKGIQGAIAEIKNDLSVGRYDVVMDTGPGYETRREEGAEALISLLSIQPLASIVAQVGADLVFRSLDHPYMQELADRIAAQTPEGLKKLMADMPAQARSVIEALVKQNDALKQQLQAHESGLAKEQLREHGENKRAELKAGVDVFLEGMKHGHETQMAEREGAQLVAESQNGQ